MYAKHNPDVCDHFLGFFWPWLYSSFQGYILSLLGWMGCQIYVFFCYYYYQKNKYICISIQLHKSPKNVCEKDTIKL